jgi:hypothetical protein
MCTGCRVYNSVVTAQQHVLLVISQEMARRRAVYAENMAVVDAHNAAEDVGAGGKGWRLGEGPFSDMTNEEFVETVRLNCTCSRAVSLRQPAR